ncbi:hypothetical protein LTR37_011254 [Vermiconidia calcicola]|uniref:Uncharacterized protein n=1 Tax=Vermiconidia calcicola TaxID=1690605 RepID=A0ACC3N3F2_9PEZI|nr:hypothetical protein LTR37_011254 [Vermiconidia calcicola]
MFSNFATIAATTLAVVGLGNAHLIMKHPVPYGVDTLDNSPLHDAKPGTGESDYPCKQRPGVYDITKMNNMAVGEPQLLDFEGTASHGGGTCQIAVTLDKEPDYNSQFKIIQVFEGGCPTSSDGTTESFTFKIPEGFPNGQATLAWSWYNMIGNREMYMNCAPITVTGGSDSQDYYNSLPNMYVIAMPTSECTTSQDGGSQSVIIPNPGQFITKKTAGQFIGKASGTGCAAAAAAQLNGVTGYKGSGGDAAPPAGGSSAAPSSYAPSGAPSAGPSGAPSSAPGGYSAAPSSAAAGPSGMVSSYAPAPSSAAAAPSSAAGGSAYPSMVPSSGAGVAPSSAVASGYATAAPSAAPSGGACSSSGMGCSSDGTKFGLCANGQMVWQPVAPGTSCRNGQIVKRHEYRNAHVRRHIQGAGRHLS